MPGDNLSFYLLDGNQAGKAARLYCNLMAVGRCLFGFVLIYLFIHLPVACSFPIAAADKRDNA